jgi:hypothetical protein
MPSKYVAHLLATLQCIPYSGEIFLFLMTDVSAATLLKGLQFTVTDKPVIIDME